MTRFMLFCIASILLLVGCNQDQTNSHNDKNTPVVAMESNVDHNLEISPGTEQESPKYLAQNEDELSIQESQTAYEMCVRALNDYYKAVWNGSDINLDEFIDNENLKQYTQKKIQYQFDLHSTNDLTGNPVKSVEIGTRGMGWEVEYIDDEDGAFLYLKLPAEIKKTVGSYGEPTEFLVRNVDGKIVIVDWYTGAKDSYDFLVRGENVSISDPDIWDDHEWVMNLYSRQAEFSGS